MKEIIHSYSQAIDRLEEALNQEQITEISRDASIQRFEFTVELAWKSIQKFLRQEQIICRSPKECLKEAFTFGLIQDDKKWIQMMEDRNLTVHTYQERMAEEIYTRLNQYIPLFKDLLTHLEKN